MNEYREREAERPTFEDTYPMYDFAPLVAIILALGGWIAGLQRSRHSGAARDGAGVRGVGTRGARHLICPSTG